MTDPDGIDDLIGGSLVDPASGRSYGAFATAAAEGAYSIRLRWSEIQAVSAIEAPAGGAPRGFRAEFYDVAGTKATQVLTLTLTCGTDWVCNGECTNVAVDAWNCGACGVQTGFNVDCVDGQLGCRYNNQAICGADGCMSLETREDCGACGHDCNAMADARPGWQVEDCVLDAQAPSRCVLANTVAAEQLEAGLSCAAICGQSGFTCYEDAAFGAGEVLDGNNTFTRLSCTMNVSHLGTLYSAYCRCAHAAGAPGSR